MANLTQVENLSYRLFKEHSLDEDWKLEYYGRMRVGLFGQCNSDLKRIRLNPLLVTQNTLERVEKTVLHEIAHAVVGSWYQHTKPWIDQMVKMGQEPKRCFQFGEHDVIAPPPAWTSEGQAARRAYKSKLDYRITGSLDLSDL